MAHLTDPPNAGPPDRHWNAVYAEGDRDRSWWQDEPAESLEAIALVAPAHDAPILDVGGGSSQLAGSLLERGHTDVTVLDLSSVALELARRRLGGQGERVTWIVADVLSWTPPRRYALWHDRAVLHFFTDPKDRARYAERVRAAVTEGGHAIIATFAPDGPDRCSGLPVQRSSAADIAELLGNDFRMVDARTRPHRTPAGAIQPFTWVVAQASNS
jgi:SAM-dependent methyltransferase